MDLLSRHNAHIDLPNIAIRSLLSSVDIPVIMHALGRIAAKWMPASQCTGLLP